MAKAHDPAGCQNKMPADGGPAFPLPRESEGVSEQVMRSMGFHKYGDGMSLRDWFAGQVLAGLTEEDRRIFLSQNLAGKAYAIADAMLEARRGPE